MFNKKTQSISTKRQRTEKLSPRTKNYSYYESRSNSENKDRIHPDDRRQVELKNQNKRRPWYIRAANTLLILIILVFIAYDLLLSTNPKLVITGSTNTTKLFSVSQAKYQAAADKLFADSISSRSKITINTSAISKDLEKEFPELSSVSISLPVIGHQPVITLVPAQPAIIVTSQGETGSFLIATNGSVLASNTVWPKNTLPKVVDETGINYAIGQTTISPADISFIDLISSQFKAKSILLTSMTLPPQSRELDVYISGESYFIKFNLEDSTDALQQIGTYFATRQYLINNQITPLKYVDAMVVGRVYYQ